MIVTYNGAFMPKDSVRISPDDRGFLLADGVYEVICAWNGKLFQEESHFTRLARSLDALRIPTPDLAALRSACTKLLAVNHLQQGGGKVYIQITRGVAPRGHAFPSADIQPTVYASASPYTPPRDYWESGVSAIVIPDIRWARCDIKSLALLPNVLASQRAAEAGAYDSILVRDGVVTEGSHTSVCAILGGCLQTHPLTHHILGSVTRDTVLSLCATLSIPVRESPILEQSLASASEVMFLGTTTGVMPVVTIGGAPVGQGTPGPITRRLQAALHAMMLGD